MHRLQCPLAPGPRCSARGYARGYERQERGCEADEVHSRCLWIKKMGERKFSIRTFLQDGSSTRPPVPFGKGHCLNFLKKTFHPANCKKSTPGRISRAKRFALIFLHLQGFKGPNLCCSVLPKRGQRGSVRGHTTFASPAVDARGRTSPPVTARRRTRASDQF